MVYGMPVSSISKLIQMKITLCILAGALLACSAHSQETHPHKSSLYIKGGLNLANISAPGSGRIQEANVLETSHIGFMGDVPLGKVVALQPGLLLTGKGSKTINGQLNASYFKTSFNPHYIELPVNIVCKVPLGKKDGSTFFIGAGPYAAIGVGGKNKTGNSSDISGSRQIEFTNNDPTLLTQPGSAGLDIIHRWDFGFNTTAGFQLHKALFSFNYGYGLTKINWVAKNSPDKNRNRVLSISVGFKI